MFTAMFKVKNSIMREKNYEKTIKKANDILEHYDNILREVEKYNLNKITKENVRDTMVQIHYFKN